MASKSRFPILLKLALEGVPPEYTAADLEERAAQCLEGLEGLLSISSQLKNSKFAYVLSIIAHEGRAKHQILIGLEPRGPILVDLFQGNVHAAQSSLEEDTAVFINACKSAPQRCAAAQVAFALHVAACVMDWSGPEVHDLEDRYPELFKGRNIRHKGELGGAPMQLTLEHVGLDWDSKHSTVRARVHREKDGYSLVCLNGPTAVTTRGKSRVRMEIPNDRTATARLDASTHNGTIESLIVRFGREPGASAPTRADFLRFSEAQEGV